MNNNLLKDLSKRNLLSDISDQELFEKFLDEKKPIYIGFDPTASSLHLGHYISLCLINRFINYGIEVIIIIGELTAQIGDPSFKKNQRIVLSKEEIDKNSINLKNQILKLCPKSKILSNIDFLKNEKLESISSILQNITNFINVSDVLGKKFIKDRISNGLTLTEMLYSVFQAYDFYYLNKNHNIFIQMGGEDQWGNITIGLDFVYKKTKNKCVGITFPLLLDKNGNKFGKSSNNAIFLNDDPHTIYQYLINISDDLAYNFFLMISVLELKEIKIILEQHKADTKKKIIQNLLCKELISKLYSSSKYEAIKNSKENLLLNKDYLEKINLLSLKDVIPTFYLKENLELAMILKQFNICSSLGEAKRLIISKGITIFKEENNCQLLKKGKKHFYLIIRYV